MANIVIYNKCNAKCPYCFAHEVMEKEVECITLPQLELLLAKIGAAPYLGIIGGEPTLHPEFEQIYKRFQQYAKTYNSQLVLFTNGINLEKYMPIIGKETGVLINCIDNTLNKDFYLDLIQKYNSSYKDCFGLELGINIYPNVDTSYFWELQDYLNTNKIRCAVVSPQNKFKNYLNMQSDYYKLVKDSFINLCKGAVDRGIKIVMDCSFIPLCYFTNEEIGIITRATMGYHQKCQPVLDIEPDGTVSYCFGTGITDSLFKYKSLADLYEKFKIVEPYLKNRNSKASCKNCSESINDCANGCLCFTNNSCNKSTVFN